MLPARFDFLRRSLWWLCWGQFGRKRNRTVRRLWQDTRWEITAAWKTGSGEGQGKPDSKAISEGDEDLVTNLWKESSDGCQSRTLPGWWRQFKGCLNPGKHCTEATATGSPPLPSLFFPHHFQPTAFPPAHQESNYCGSHHYYSSYHGLPSPVIFFLLFSKDHLNSVIQV